MEREVEIILQDREDVRAERETISLSSLLFIQPVFPLKSSSSFLFSETFLILLSVIPFLVEAKTNKEKEVRKAHFLFYLFFQSTSKCLFVPVKSRQPWKKV